MKKEFFLISRLKSPHFQQADISQALFRGLNFEADGDVSRVSEQRSECCLVALWPISESGYAHAHPALNASSFSKSKRTARDPAGRFAA
jgi:hypothetical protein